VSSYLAFSTLPALRCQRTGGVFSVTLSVTAILQLRRPRVFRGMLPYGVRTFLSGLLRSDHLPSRGIYHRLEKQKEGMNLEARKTRRENKAVEKTIPKGIPGFQILLDSFDHWFHVSIVDLPRSTQTGDFYGTRSWNQSPRFFTRQQDR
jgi:hypothetical protein